MNFGDCDTILHNTPNGMKNIAEVLGPNGEVYWSATKELTGVPPLSIQSNGTMLLDYLISGNMEQSGTPTPSSPIQPSECGDRTGNLFDISTTEGFSSGISDWTQTIGDTSITINASTIGGVARGMVMSLGVFPAGTYTFNWTANIAPWTLILRKKDTQNESTTVTITESSELEVNIIVGKRTYVFTDIMLNTGSTALLYEPFGIKIPILSADTTTPVYLGEVETTRKIKKLVLTGEENFTAGSVIGQIRTPLTGAIDSLGYCTHYIIKAVYGGDFPYIRIRSNTLWFEISPDGYETKEEAVVDFKSYLAQQYTNGTPVTVWYVLATETTGIVNEPLRKIGDYADTVSYEQSQVSIPTLHGNTVIDVETTLKPSQMYIKYK